MSISDLISSSETDSVSSPDCPLPSVESPLQGSPMRIQHTAKVALDVVGRRLDWVCAHYFDAFSRSRLQSWIKAGRILVNGQVESTKYSAKLYDLIELDAQVEEDIEWEAVPQEIQPIFVDEHLILINKPAGLVVHPAVGHARDTLVNALLCQFPELRALPRAGIVHRLDKGTTGLMVVARTLQAHTSIVRQLESRTVARKYQAIVQAAPISGSLIDLPIGRHPKNRIKMAVRENVGKPARTRYRILKRLGEFSLLDVKLDTGRTHQIRVHFAHLGMPILGDQLYGARLKIPKGCSDGLADQLRGFKRQALHAYQLGFDHPISQERVEWKVPLPQDMQDCLFQFETV